LSVSTFFEDKPLHVYKSKKLNARQTIQHTMNTSLWEPGALNEESDRITL